MKLEINNQQVKIKMTLRAVMTFEQITGKPVNMENMTDAVALLYSCYLTAATDPLTFDEFLAEIDNRPDVIVDFCAMLANELTNPVPVVPPAGTSIN